MTMECGRCGGAAPTTHYHTDDEGRAYVAHDCAFAGSAYVPGACHGDDLCDDCVDVEEGEA